MPLTSAQIRTVWRAILDTDPSVGQVFAKSDLDAAVAAVDAWATTNQASYVASLPEPFKSSSTAAQKALLLAYVALKRAGVI